MKKSFLIGGIILITILSIGLLNREKVTGKYEYELFSNPHQMGEIALYNQEGMTFKFQLPVHAIDQLSETSVFLDKIKAFDNNRLSKAFAKNVFLVEHQNLKKDVLQHVQIQYFLAGGSYMVFSAYEVDNPDFVLSDCDPIVKNIKVHQSENDRIYESSNLTVDGLTQYYYQYDPIKDRFNLAVAAGNEIYAYKEGILFHLFYNDLEQENQAMTLFKEFINIDTLVH